MAAARTGVRTVLEDFVPHLTVEEIEQVRVVDVMLHPPNNATGHQFMGVTELNNFSMLSRTEIAHRITQDIGEPVVNADTIGAVSLWMIRMHRSCRTAIPFAANHLLQQGIILPPLQVTEMQAQINNLRTDVTNLQTDVTDIRATVNLIADHFGINVAGV